MARKDNNSGSGGSSSYTYKAVSNTPQYDPGEYTPSQYEANTYNGTYTPGTYRSQYTGQITNARNNVINWKYDPTKDANYQALAAVYGARGDLAAKDTLGDAAMLNGGYGTSYATAAAQQARNQYNQELMSMIPQLEESAYNRAMGTYNILMDADNTAYGRFRDTEGDRQFAANYGLDVWNANEGSRQWAAGMNQNENQFAASYGLDRANLLNSYYQWAEGFNSDWYKWNKEQQNKGGSGGGSGGRGGGGSGGGGGGGYTPTDPNLDYYIAGAALGNMSDDANNAANNPNKRNNRGGGGGNNTQQYR